MAFKINTMAAECDVSILLVRVTEIEFVTPAPSAVHFRLL